MFWTVLSVKEEEEASKMARIDINLRVGGGLPGKKLVVNRHYVKSDWPEHTWRSLDSFTILLEDIKSGSTAKAFRL